MIASVGPVIVGFVPFYVHAACLQATTPEIHYISVGVWSENKASILQPY